MDPWSAVAISLGIATLLVVVMVLVYRKVHKARDTRTQLMGTLESAADAAEAREREEELEMLNRQLKALLLRYDKAKNITLRHSLVENMGKIRHRIAQLQKS